MPKQAIGAIMAASDERGSPLKRVWLIEGYDSLDKIFEVEIDVNLIPPCNLAPMLQCLVAKHGLTDGEIVGSFRKRKTRRRLSHLDVVRPDRYGSLSCGSNPYFHATV